MCDIDPKVISPESLLYETARFILFHLLVIIQDMSYNHTTNKHKYTHQRHESAAKITHLNINNLCTTTNYFAILTL